MGGGDLFLSSRIWENMQCFMGGTISVLDACQSFVREGVESFLGYFLLLSTLACLSVCHQCADSLLSGKIQATWFVHDP